MAGPKDAKPAAKKQPGASKKTEKGAFVSRLYEILGNHAKRKNKVCPKCGPGVFMASHKDRITCGKCKYTEKNR